jgi:hypothetical protein
MGDWLLIQVGQTILGQGNTAEEARQDAAPFLRKPSLANYVPTWDDCGAALMLSKEGDYVIIKKSDAKFFGFFC